MASHPSSDPDPGWGHALKEIGWGLVPGVGWVRRRQVAHQPDLSALALTRTTFASFAWALVMIGVVAVILAANDWRATALSPGPVAAAVAVVGLLFLLATYRVPPRLDGTSPEALATSYRTRFFLRIAFAESAALVGFLGFILTGRPLVYLAGAAFAAVGFVSTAPTTRNLARDQDDLKASGSTQSLHALLVDLRMGGD